MCLYKVDKKTRRASSGWKVFTKSEKYLDYSYVKPDCFYKGVDLSQGCQPKRYFPTEQWIEDICNYEIKAGLLSDYYPTGFHIFKSYKQAQHWKRDNQVICRVLMENIVASGTQWVTADSQAIIFVAKKIFVQKPK